jgi:hypothetical protein
MFSDDLLAFRDRLQREGLTGALAFLNARTPHRFTGVFRFDGDTLRNVALVDKWDAVEQLGDAPISATFCGCARSDGVGLEVLDGRHDPRFPHMADNAVVSYCGAVIKSPDGEPFGTICHYDLQPCQTRTSDMPLLVAAAALLYEVLGTPSIARATDSATSMPSTPADMIPPA